MDLSEADFWIDCVGRKMVGDNDGGEFVVWIVVIDDILVDEGGG